VASHTTGKPVAIPELDHLAQTWPRVRAVEIKQRVKSMHSVPLRLRATTIGSLNLFWDRLGGLGVEDLRTVQALADTATIGILQERAIRESDVARVQLQHALSSRVLIEQAKGVVAFTHTVNMEEAFTLLRNHARNNGKPLVEVAEQVVNRTLSL
jgi:GAF domain-containing protein